PPAEDAVAVVGKVVDEQGAPVGGIAVRLLGFQKDNSNTTTDPQGNFRLTLPHRTESTRLLWAEDPDGRREGMAHFTKVEDAQDLLITLKPARRAMVRVVDAQGRAVGGATVALLEASIHTLRTATTRADGTVALTYPADATIGHVFAFKSCLGFDYWTTSITRRSQEHKPLPEEVTLKLTGARTVRVKAGNSANQPVVGVPIFPWYVQQNDK